MGRSVHTGVVDLEDLGEVAALCYRALPEEHFTIGDLEAALFGADQPAIVRGDPDIGVIATVRGLGDDAAAYVRLLVVDPDYRNQGVGSELLEAAEADAVAGGARTLVLGADAPFYLFPGVPADGTALLCLLEKRGFTRAEANLNMRIELAGIGTPLLEASSVSLADAALADEVRAFTEEHYPHWTAEAQRALRRGSLLVRHDDAGALLGFCAVDVNRRGTLGPIAVRPDRVGAGDGEPLLLGALHHVHSLGREDVEVCWVGPIRPYARVGGKVSRVFYVHRKRLAS